MEMATLRTERLVLRPWRDDDRAPFAAMNADPEVMRYFQRPLDRGESDALVDRIRARFADDGYGLWAVEVPGTAPFAGFVGLSRPVFAAHFTPCTEIGWRLARPYWGRGYATEGATAALDFAFRHAGLSEVVSFATVGNARSHRVMRRLGMTRAAADDFDHPALPEGHPLRPHVLYRAKGADWLESRPTAPRLNPR